MKSTCKKMAPLVLLVLSLGSVTAKADDGVSLGVFVDLPPLVFQAPPPMVWYPSLGVYIALGSPYRLFFYGGDYFYFRNGEWFIGLGYGGPWRRIDRMHLPPHLRDYRDDDWPHYQHDADGYFRKGFRNTHPPFPAWRDRIGDDNRGHDWGWDRGADRDRGRDRDHR